MKVLTDHWKAILKSFDLLANGNFLLYFLPGIIGAIVAGFISAIFSWIFGGISLVGYLPWVGDAAESGVNTFYGWVEATGYFIYSFVILTLFSPFNSMLSEKLDNKLTGHTFDGGFARIISDIVRTIGVLIVGMILNMTIIYLWNLISEPFNGDVLSPYITFIITSFFIGFNSYDFSLERYQVSIGESWKFAFKKPLYMILTGLLFTLTLSIPYIGLILAPVILTMIATIIYIDIRPSEKILIKEENNTIQKTTQNELNSGNEQSI